MPVDNHKVTFVVIACLACAAHGVQAGAKTFDVAAAYGSAMGIAVAFLDNDGVQDLAVATSYVSGVTILFGNCSGSFGDRMDLPVGTFASAVAAGDFDGDGIADLVVGGDALYVIRGLGHRMFAPAVQVSSNGTLKLRLADVTGDGRLDVVIAGSTSSIAILRGRGDGTFAAPTFVGLGASAFDVAVGDLNGDGIQDMATANADAGTISVILSHGDGTFAPSTSLSVGGYPYSIALSDLDGDGTADIVAGRAGAQVISVYRSRGDGTFFAGVDYASPGDYSICTADLNDDGSPDIVQSDGSMSVTSFLNRGDGMFSSGRLFAANSSPVAVAAGLLDGDNHVDLAVVNANAPRQWGRYVRRCAVVHDRLQCLEPHIVQPQP